MGKMGRYYKLSKKITEDMAAEILKETLAIEEVEKAEFQEENSKIMVLTEKDNYPDVMTRIVNICSRIGKGCELSFAGFAFEEVVS